MAPVALNVQALAVRALMTAGVAADRVDEAVGMIDLDPADNADTIATKVASARTEILRSQFDRGQQIGEAMAARNSSDPFATFKPIGNR